MRPFFKKGYGAAAYLDFIGSRQRRSLPSDDEGALRAGNGNAEYHGKR